MTCIKLQGSYHQLSKDWLSRSNLLDRSWGWGHHVLGAHMRMLRTVAHIRGAVGGRPHHHVPHGRWHVGYMMKGGDPLTLWGHSMAVRRVTLGGHAMKTRWGLVLHGHWGHRPGTLGWRHIGGHVHGRVLGLAYKLVLVHKVSIWIVVIHG